MSKHTPGPWRLQKEDGGYCIYSGPYSFAFTWEFLDEEMKTAQANARLIASAPDLLEALLMVRDADDDAIMDCISKMPTLARAAVDAAIAKATGND